MLNNSYLEIDTGILAANLAAIKETLPAGTKIIPVLKDDAYGLGAVPVARVLVAAGTDTIAVSHISEALELREAGIDCSIQALSIPLDFQLEAAAEAGVIITLGAFRQFELLKGLAEKRAARIPVQLKIDSGMHRIGFKAEEIPELIEKLKEYGSCLDIRGTFSHFANSRKPDTNAQYSLFCSVLQQLEQAGINPGLRHIASSAQTELCSDYSMDAVRIGRRLYMDNPDAPLGTVRELVSYRSYIADIRMRRAGEHLAYGNGVILGKDTRIGIMAIGYGDGLNLDLVKIHAPVLINGRQATVLATCMDQSFIDLDNVECRPGDEVTLFGYDGRGGFLSSQYLANLIGGNEGCGLTSALTSRVRRIYK